MPRKTLVRKLDQLGYSRDEISAVTGHSNIKSLDSYLDTMNERKSTELSLAVSGISSKALQVQNPSSSISSASQLAVQEDSAVQPRSMSTTTSQMCASTQSFIKPRPNDRNMPTQHIATLAQHVACVWPPCCDMLGVVGSNLTSFKLEPTTSNMLKHIATRWPNGRNMLRPTMLRYVALACCYRLAGALQAPLLPIHSCISFLPFICRLLEIISAARQPSTSHSTFSLRNDRKSLDWKTLQKLTRMYFGVVFPFH